ncbi:MAG: pyridoxal-phosphate dependent enzyme [Anaerolineales bacterium]|nr:pyridoxal-phosphate dependent enzyme [Anaerolineales bacterium]
MNEKFEPLRFAHLPTPLEHLSRLLNREDGPDLWIKRDDQTGLAFGGNKTRKLEYLLADALNIGARTLITRGAIQSNHCRQTAAAAARTGLNCTLVLTGDPPEEITGNVLLDELLGALIVWTSGNDPETVMHQTFGEAQERGLKPYLIPYGGSNHLGVLAYAEAMQEVIQQGFSGDRIVLASSSGGTQAGLCLGAALYGFEGKITGISVDLPAGELTEIITKLIETTSSWLDVNVQIHEGTVEVNDAYLGEGYGVVGEIESGAIDAFAKKEGILLDPVYTARAAGGMLDMIHRGEIESDEKVLFWHTGGTPAIFAYGEEITVESSQ